MYAKDTEQYETAKDDFQEMCSHEKYRDRVDEFILREEEWVLLFREWQLTRGHNTNNFAEANIRILKDIILERLRALNAVALADFTINVWDTYFRNRLLKFAYNRVRGPYLKYDTLVKRMPLHLAEKIVVLENDVYVVPSATESESSYEVQADIGTCSCYAGRHGAFCKHQALVHKTFPNLRLFPNAPAVTCEKRHALGVLALGEKCPPMEYFRGLQETIDPSEKEQLTMASIDQDISEIQMVLLKTKYISHKNLYFFRNQ